MLGLIGTGSRYFCLRPPLFDCLLLMMNITYQAMRVIINDKRYGALKAHGERKQAFNEVNPLIVSTCVYIQMWNLS